MYRIVFKPDDDLGGRLGPCPAPRTDERLGSAGGDPVLPACAPRPDASTEFVQALFSKPVLPASPRERF